MTFDPRIGRWLSEDPIGFQAADPNLYRYVGNNPTNATDPSGLYELPYGWSGGVATFYPGGPRYDGITFYTDPSEYEGKLKYSGGDVMRYLSFSRYSWGGLGAETWEYRLFAQGCMGLNKLRLNNDYGPFDMPGARSFATLDAAVKAQQEMIATNDKRKRIVITAYQDNYLNEQLTHLLLPGSKVEYDMTEIVGIRGEGLKDIKPKGTLSTFDFVTVHQNADLSA